MPDKKILVAEDEPDIRGLIIFSLQYAGFEVVEAVNGEDAVQKATEEMPDLIVSIHVEPEHERKLLGLPVL